MQINHTFLLCIYSFLLSLVLFSSFTLSFLSEYIPTAVPSSNVLSQDCALMLTAHRVSLVPAFVVLLIKLLLVLLYCSLCHLDHDSLPGSVFVEILRSSGCCLPREESRRREDERDKMCKANNDKNTEINEARQAHCPFSYD